MAKRKSSQVQWMAIFHREFREDLEYRGKADQKTALRLLRIVEDVMRDPFQGMGKPEPLQYLAESVWSRPLTREHRVVYRVREHRIDFLQGRYHY